MSRELTVRPVDWQLIQNMAPAMVASRLFGVTKEQAPVIMLKGHELGFGLATSFEFIHVIEGKAGISPRGALALIHDSGELAGLRIEDKVDSCTVWMKRKNGAEYTATFTMDDAKRARLTEGSPKKSGGKRGYGNWEKYPANMLRWRAVGYCADVVFPDIIGGMLRPEELGAEVDEQGEPWVVTVPESEVTTTTTYDALELATEPLVEFPTDKGVPGPTAEDVVDADAYSTIESLMVAGWTPEQIMAANEDTPPATAKDCQEVAEILLEAAARQAKGEGEDAAD